MNNYIFIDNKKIKLSKETINNIKSQLNIEKNKQSIDPQNISSSYKYMNDIDWEKEKKYI